MFKYDFYAIRNSFVKQIGPENCGLASLAMILNYGGLLEEANTIVQLQNNNGSALSLLDLKKLAARFNLDSRCVAVDFERLGEVPFPCIVHLDSHLGNSHFQVCYGLVKHNGRDKYLLADPTCGLHFFTPQEFNSLWKSKAAVVFPEIKPMLNAFRFHPGLELLRCIQLPGMIYCIVPLLTIAATLLGFAISWVLQKGLMSSGIFQQVPVISVVVILLFFISISRSAFTFIRQRIVLKIHSIVSNTLAERFFSVLGRQFTDQTGIAGSFWIRENMTDIAKISGSLDAFTAILSEGSVTLLMVIITICFDPIAGLVNLGFFATTLILSHRLLPTIRYENARLKEMRAVNGIALAFQFTDRFNETERSNLLALHLKQQQHFISGAHRFGLWFGSKAFLIELFGAFTIMVIFFIVIHQLNTGRTDYDGLVITIFIGLLTVTGMPRMFYSLVTYTEGIEAFIQFQQRTR